MVAEVEKLEGLTTDSTAEALGRMILVCEKLEVYMTWNLWDWHRLFLPPIRLKQYRIFNDGTSDIGFFTWGKFSSDVSNFVELRHFDPRPYEWNSGDRLWIMDMVCSSKYSRKVGLWIQRELFTDEFIQEQGLDDRYPAKAIRRAPDRSVRKIATFAKRNISDKR